MAATASQILPLAALDAPAAAAVAWLFRPPVSEPSGAVRAGLELGRGPGFVYHEITAYQVSLAVNLWRWTGEARFLDAAERSGRYLLAQRATEGPAAGSVPRAVEGNGRVDARHFAFDNAIVLQGFLALHDATSDPRWLEAARGLGEWLLRVQDPDGSFRCGWDATRGTMFSPPGAFFGDRGCLHVKHAIALLRLAEATGDSRFRDAARKLCQWGLRLQREDGWFWANEERDHVFAHAHAYAAEGYAVAADLLGSASYASAFQRAADALMAVQRADGGIPAVLHDRRPALRRWRAALEGKAAADATAQAVRLWLLRPAARTPVAQASSSQTPEAPARGLRFLQALQAPSPQDAAGGFHASRGHGPPRRSAVPTWAAQFAVHAFHLAAASGDGGRGIAELF
jgi:rhamnogalacturonyl hydrolase YesR